MNRDHIISEIQRTASANNGLPLGRRRFEQETGIDRHAWYGKYWPRWSEAVREAGFEPNKLQKPHEPSLLIEKLVALTRSLGRLPALADLLFARNHDPTFPCRNTFIRRLGFRSERARSVLAFCRQNPGYDDVAAIWTVDSGLRTHSDNAPRLPASASDRSGLEVRAADSDAASWLPSPPEARTGTEGVREPAQAGYGRLPSPPSRAREAKVTGGIGYVYLLKHGQGREYKIGRTRNPLRREGQVALELPNELAPIHYIKTDDPTGIESYWHARFKTKRKRGEWFTLTADDVRAFRRWKRIH